MLYVDENLCAGCGLCVDVCTRGAISLEGALAHIDPARCTSCGRCVEACPAAAIIDAEIVDPMPSRPSHPLTRQQPVVTSHNRAEVYPQNRAEVPSKLEIADKVLSGLLGVLTFAFDWRRRGAGTSSWRRMTPGSSRPSAGRGSGCSRGKNAGHGYGGRAFGHQPRSGEGHHRRHRQRYVR